MSESSLTWVPNLVIGLLSLLVGVVTQFMLPETKEWPLPQSIADMHRYNERKNHHPVKEEIAEAEAAL